MKRFHQTIMAGILEQYDIKRKYISLMTVFYTIQYFKPTTILEMGFYEGQTFGIMLEAADLGCELTAIDIEYRMHLFDRYYAASKDIAGKKIDLLTVDSREFETDSQFDFINVDTGWSNSPQELRQNDFLHAVALIPKNGIIMLDNYSTCLGWLPKFLERSPTVVPFFKDDQALYFHHIGHDANDFLDGFLPEIFPKEFVSSYNTNFHGHLITDIKPLAMQIHQYMDLVKIYCRIKNI